MSVDFKGGGAAFVCSQFQMNSTERCRQVTPGQVTSVIKLLESSHILQVMFFSDCLPERDHVAQFCGQAAELIGRQVQVDQVGQLGDVRGDAGQVVVVDVQRGQVGERP